MTGLIPSKGTLLRILAWALAWPFLAVLGVVVAIVSFVRGARALRQVSAVGGAVLACARGHRNDVVGRWLCARCGGEFLGWVGACEICHDESADWFPCQECGLAIPLPWRPRE